MAKTEIRLTPDEIVTQYDDEGNLKLIVTDSDKAGAFVIDPAGDPITGVKNPIRVIDKLDLEDRRSVEVVLTDEDGLPHRFEADFSTATISEDNTQIEVSLKSSNSPDDNLSPRNVFVNLALASTSPAYLLYTLISGRAMNSLTFINNTNNKFQVAYVAGDLAAGAILQTQDVGPYDLATVSGKTYTGWDLSAQIKAWNVIDYKQGLTVQVKNPYLKDPVIGFNMNGNTYNSGQFPKKKWKTVDEKWSWKHDATSSRGDRAAIQDIDFVVANGKGDTNWFIQFYPSGSSYQTYTASDNAWMWQ